MRILRLGIGLAAVVAIALQPVAASAQPVVPPGNSAANQYTETYPTAGGNTPTGNGSAPSPAKALGTRNARRLQALGPQGRAAAAVAAATAPAVEIEAASGRPHRGSSPKKNAEDSPTMAHPGGSSGLSEVIGQATGSSSSGRMGLLLPLIILGVIAWSIAHVWRRRTGGATPQ